jgi:hypothetical protein
VAYVKRLLCALALVAIPAQAAQARRPQHRAAPPSKASARKAAVDPAHWFASRPGLTRVYEGRTAARKSDEAEQGPPAGASCEVLESRPADSLAAGTLRESCTMIVARKARPATELSYELRKSGIFMVRAQSAAAPQPQTMERLVLPGPVRVGAAWREPQGQAELARSVKSAGQGCKAAGRTFADCLVLAVVQRQGKKTLRKYTEVYAAGVGLVEDAQWELVDVKGL